MPSSVFHVLVATNDAEAVTGFLADVVGMGPVRPMSFSGAELARVLGWPDETPDCEGAMVGGGSGRVEVVHIPDAVADRVRPGIVFASFACRDLEERVEAARRAGASVTGPFRVGEGDATLTVALADTGGARFELIRFGE